MIFRTPSYYSSFSCSADRCSDNCCIGWEIDIDEKTAEFYRGVKGDFGRRLRENISSENSFILKNERCPFLNDKNLCDIIISCGENHLCQICSDHPRFYEWYGNIKEGGVGLCCEEAAKLILTVEDTTFAQSEVNDTPEEIDEELFSLLFSAREELFSITEKKDLTVKEKLCLLLDSAEKIQLIIDNPHLAQELMEKSVSIPLSDNVSLKELVNIFSSFEPIDESWTKEAESLQKSLSGECYLSHTCKTEEKFILNLVRYFLFRYFLKGTFDGEVLSKVKLGVVSILMIKAMCENKSDLAVWVEKSKLYSKQMEYSDENRELFYDYTYEKNCLSTSSIKALIMKCM